MLHQLLLHAIHDGLRVGMKTFAKAITSHSIPRLREAMPCSHSISSESPHELRMVRKRGQPIQLSTIPGHPGISVGQSKKKKKHQFSTVEVGVEGGFRHWSQERDYTSPGLIGPAWCTLCPLALF